MGASPHAVTSSVRRQRRPQARPGRIATGAVLLSKGRFKVSPLVSRLFLVSSVLLLFLSAPGTGLLPRRLCCRTSLFLLFERNMSRQDGGAPFSSHVRLVSARIFVRRLSSRAGSSLPLLLYGLVFSPILGLPGPGFPRQLGSVPQSLACSS